MPLNVNGTLSLLRVHDLGTGYGPPNDEIDVEVVVQFAGDAADAYGFQLRNDDNQPARQGMLDLLRDGFNHDWTVWIDYDAVPGHHNNVAMRVWLTKPAPEHVTVPVVTHPVIK
jgi:hypothetical protein